jgi:hypothetical protein
LVYLSKILKYFSRKKYWLNRSIFRYVLKDKQGLFIFHTKPGTLTVVSSFLMPSSRGNRSGRVHPHQRPTDNSVAILGQDLDDIGGDYENDHGRQVPQKLQAEAGEDCNRCK